MIRVAEYRTRSKVRQDVVKLSNGSVMLADDFEAQLPMIGAWRAGCGYSPNKGGYKGHAARHEWLRNYQVN